MPLRVGVVRGCLLGMRSNQGVEIIDAFLMQPIDKRSGSQLPTARIMDEDDLVGNVPVSRNNYPMRISREIAR